MLLALLLGSCSSANWHPDPPLPGSPDSKLVVDVFWSASDSEDGYSAIREAANAAMGTDEYNAVKPYIDLNLKADEDSPDEAAKIARDVSLDPHTLAVIGHSRSGTTRASMPFYSEANIPVLMPAATSPYVIYEFDEARGLPSIGALKDKPKFPNAFRLRPSDVPDQVGAMKLALEKLARSRDAKRGIAGTKIMLICDTTSLNGSDVYTKPMCDSILSDPDLSPKIVSYRPFALDSDVYGLVTEIHAVTPDYIIILGYPELARIVLEELVERKPSGQTRLPYTFIMADACLQNNLTRFSRDIYVTSSFNGGQVSSCKSTLAQQLYDHLNKAKPADVAMTDEFYTFDAVLILLKAVKSCEDHLDRLCVMNYLVTNEVELGGACETYQIYKGERQNAAFNVNSVCGDAFQVKWLARKGNKTLDDNPHWCAPSSK